MKVMFCFGPDWNVLAGVYGNGTEGCVLFRNIVEWQEWIGIFGRGVLRSGGDWQERNGEVRHGLHWPVEDGQVRFLITNQMAKKPKKVYSFRVPGLFGNLSAEDAAKELEKIRSNHGELRPEYVVEDAKDENSILHDYFDWDDSSAAAKYRAQQARVLINNIKVEVKTTKVFCNVKAFVNVVTDTNKLRTYVPINEVLADNTAYADLLSQAKDDMSSFIDKYNRVSELSGVTKEMLKVLNSK